MGTLGDTVAVTGRSTGASLDDDPSGKRAGYVYPADLLSDDRFSEQPFSEQEGSAPSCSVSAGRVEAPLDFYGPTWWLVYTKSRQEKRLSAQLSEMRVPHYLPVHRREAVTRGRVRQIEEPLFSGYLFLFGDADERRAALSTNRISVTHRVSDARRLRYELSQIARSIACGARLTVEAKLVPGDWVRVKCGAHEGLEGIVLRRQGKTRLVLSVNFLKQGASLEIHDSLLERTDPPRFDDTLSVELCERTGR